MHSRPERVNGHIGTETRPRLLREAAVGNFRQWAQADTAQTPTGGSSREFSAMGASLTEQRRVSDEGFRIVKLCCKGRMARIDSAIDGTLPESHG